MHSYDAEVGLREWWRLLNLHRAESVDADDEDDAKRELQAHEVTSHLQCDMMLAKFHTLCEPSGFFSTMSHSGREVKCVDWRALRRFQKC